MEEEGVVIGSKLIEVRKERGPHEAQIVEYLEKIVVVIEVVLASFPLLALVVSERAYVFFPLQYQLEHVDC